MADLDFNKQTGLGYGLGALFQAEGPEVVGGRLRKIPSYYDSTGAGRGIRSDILNEMGIMGVDPRLVRELDQKTGTGNSAFGIIPNEIPSLAALQKEIAEVKSMAVPLSSSLKNLQESKKIADRMEGMPDDSDVFAASPLDMMAAPMPEFSVTAEGKKVTGQESTAQNLITDKLSQTTTGPSPEEVAMMEAARSEGQGAPAENAFMEALAAKHDAEGKEQPKAKTRAELLEKYKQEFAEATGINIDGKPDNSQALMAMGLSMMQNRAGKRFNVGKILNAVGEAGEKAMPALSAARKEAKAARVAAGKYALGQIKADEDVESAIAASELAFQREYLLKEMEMRQKDREANYKDGEVKNPYNSEVMDGLNIRMGRSRDGAKYMDPSNALKKIAATQRKVNGALETLDQMEVLLDDLGDANTGNAAKLIGDRVKTLMVAGGLTDAKVAFPETGISTEDELRAYQKSIVNEFKRFLTQETGNGISNVDIKNLEQLLADVSVFTNPLTAKKRLSRIRRIFTGKRKSVASLRDNIMDPKYYATEQEFLDNQEKFDTLLSGNTTYRFVDDAGSLIDVEDK